MSSNLTEWANFLIRWIHLIAGISWIGNSFYFMWMDSSFEPLQTARTGVDGELYMVHGGHFYHVEKQKMRPGFIPQTLHWFKWEATLTWLSGFLLLILLYYLTGGIYLVAPGFPIQDPVYAVLASLGFIFGTWFVYDAFWQSGFAAKNSRAATGISLLAVLALCWGLCQVFTGRGAYLHLGAVFATLMVLNVWIRILPGQRVMLAAAKAGQIPDYSSGTKAKWRSTHNSYMTLPVLIAMLSNHFPLAYGNSLNWLVLVMICLLGGVTRHMMMQWNLGKSGAYLLLPIGGIVGAMALLTVPTQSLAPGKPSFAQVHAIIESRCVACHAKHPTDSIFLTTAGGVMFEDPATIQKYASRIRERVVVSKTMPLANRTQITEAERTLLGQWVDSGASLQ